MNMVDPTPVSALVHSSTLVTAGVYLMICFSVAFDDSLKSLLLLTSGLTMFMVGVGANFEYDLHSLEVGHYDAIPIIICACVMTSWPLIMSSALMR
jgi:hypothetical protein